LTTTIDLTSVRVRNNCRSVINNAKEAHLLQYDNTDSPTLSIRW